MNAIDYSSSEQFVGPEDSRILALCDRRRRKLESFVDHVLQTIIHPKQKYPIGLRIICRKLRELALSREPNNERLANGLVGGFLFLRIFNPKISLYSYEIAKKDPKNMSTLRRRFTLISKVSFICLFLCLCLAHAMFCCSLCLELWSLSDKCLDFTVFYFAKSHQQLNANLLNF